MVHAFTTGEVSNVAGLQRLSWISMRNQGEANPARTVSIRLVKHRRATAEYEGELKSDDGDHIVIRAPWIGDPIDLGVVRFEEGDTFTEHYWRSRWYTVKVVYSAEGVLKGWYCDATRPAVFEDRLLTSVDLDLDLWVSADGATIVRLDQEEFIDSGWRTEDPAAATAAEAAIDELEELAGAGLLPSEGSLAGEGEGNPPFGRGVVT